MAIVPAIKVFDAEPTEQEEALDVGLSEDQKRERRERIANARTSGLQFVCLDNGEEVIADRRYPRAFHNWLKGADSGTSDITEQEAIQVIEAMQGWRLHKIRPTKFIGAAKDLLKRRTTDTAATTLPPTSSFRTFADDHRTDPTGSGLSATGVSVLTDGTKKRSAEDADLNSLNMRSR